MKIFESKLYDDFGDEWNCKASLDETETSIHVVCRKYAAYNKVDFFIPFRAEWRCDPGASKLYSKILEEVSRRINY